MSDNRHEVMIGQEAARLRDALDGRFEKKAQRTRATITSVERDAAERIVRAIATIDGSPGQLVQCTVGAVMGVGDIVEVQNQGGRTLPRWQYVRRLQTVAAVPPLDGDVSLPTPTGLDLETGVHVPEPGGGIKVWIYGSWHTIPDQFGTTDYDVQCWTNDQFEDPVQISVHDAQATTQLVADITNSDVVIPRGYAAEQFDFARFGRAFIEGEAFDYTGVTDGQGDSGTGTGGTNTFTDSGKSWDTDEWTNYALVDSAGDIFLIISNTSTVLTIVGTPASGSYYIYPCFRGCTRGVGSTTAAAHTSGVQIIRRSCGANADSLVPDTDYNVRVRAHRADGAISAWSGVISIQTDLDATAPAVPTGMDYEGLDPITIRLSWTPNTEPDLDYYEVDVGQSGGTGAPGYPIKVGNTPTATIKWNFALACTWRVRAVDTSQNASNYCVAQTAYALSPNPPTLLNGDLEAGTGSPDNWTMYSAGVIATTWQTSLYSSPTHAVKIAVTADDGSDVDYTALRSDYIAVSQGVIYDLSCKAHALTSTSNVWYLTVLQYSDGVGTPASNPSRQFTLEQITEEWGYGFAGAFMILPEDTDVTHIALAIQVNLDTTYSQQMFVDDFYMSLWFMWQLFGGGAGGGALYHSDLLGILPDQHHDQSHVIDGSDHTASGTTQYDVLGVDPADTLTFIPASADPGASAKMLRCTSAGYLSLVRLNTDTLADKSGGNLTIQPAGDLILNPSGGDILPDQGDDINFGSPQKKLKSGHFAELHIGTLVAKQILATIGGRIVVGPTTRLRADAAPTDTDLLFEHNQIIRQDVLYLEARGDIEYMRHDALAVYSTDFINDEIDVVGDWTSIFRDGVKFTIAESDANDGEWTCDGDSTYASGYTTIAVTGDLLSNSGNEGYVYYVGAQASGPFLYLNIDRDLESEGSGDQWYAGDGVLNTRQEGDGFIDIYSEGGIDSGTGPTIVGNIRQSSTYNDWLAGWAIGCLNGIYGYSAADDYGVALGLYKAAQAWVSIDDANGFRVNLGTTPTVLGQWDTSGNVKVGNTSERHILLNAAGSLQMKDGSDVLIELDSSGHATFGNVAASQANMYWNGTQLQFRGGASGTTVEAFIDTDGTLTAGGASKRVKLNTTGILLKAETGISTGVITWEDSDPKDVAQIGAVGPTNLYVWGYGSVGLWVGAGGSEVQKLNVASVVSVMTGLEVGATAQGPSSGQIFTDGDIRTSAGLSIGDKTKDMGDGWGYFANGLFVNETDLSGDMTKGIIINCGTASDEVLAFRGSNVGHGGYLTDPETFGRFSVAIADAGGLAITGHKDSYGTNAYALTLQGYLDEDADTSKTAGKGIVDFFGAQTLSGAIANVVADGNVFSWRCRRGGANVSLMWLDEDGDLYLDGALRDSDPIAVRAYHNTSQNISTGSFGPVYLNAEYGSPADIDGMHSTSTNTERVTCVTAGFYVIIATVQFAADATGVRRIRLRWYDSSATTTTTVSYHGDYGADGSTPTRMQCMAGVWLDPNDYVFIEVYQDTGSDLAVQYVADYSPTLSVAKIA